MTVALPPRAFVNPFPEGATGAGMARWVMDRVGPPEVPALDWIVLSAVLVATTAAVLASGPPVG